VFTSLVKGVTNRQSRKRTLRLHKEAKVKGLTESRGQLHLMARRTAWVIEEGQKDQRVGFEKMPVHIQDSNDPWKPVTEGQTALKRRTRGWRKQKSWRLEGGKRSARKERH